MFWKPEVGRAACQHRKQSTSPPLTPRATALALLLVESPWGCWARPQRGPEGWGLHPPRPLPPHPPPDDRWPTRLSHPKVAFYFLGLNVEVGEAELPYGPIPTPVWVGARQVLNWHPPTYPQKSGNQGLRVCPTKAATPLVPAEERATPTSKPIKRPTCQVGIFSPHTYPAK